VANTCYAYFSLANTMMQAEEWGFLSVYGCVNVQQDRLSILDLQVRQREGKVESATVQELASWVTDGAVRALEVKLPILRALWLDGSDCPYHQYYWNVFWHYSI
jgi:hypothetical protein